MSPLPISLLSAGAMTSSMPVSLSCTLAPSKNLSKSALLSQHSSSYSLSSVELLYSTCSIATRSIVSIGMPPSIDFIQHLIVSILFPCCSKKYFVRCIHNNSIIKNSNIITNKSCVRIIIQIISAVLNTMRS